jgi:hypothetical protein
MVMIVLRQWLLATWHESLLHRANRRENTGG